MTYDEVRDSADYRRVVQLPRRSVDIAAAEILADRLTPMLALHPGPRLRPLQALALWEMYSLRGAFLGLPPGEGKTLLSWLFGYTLGLRRPWLVIPGGARESTAAKFALLMRDWVCPNPPPVIHSFEELAGEQAVDLIAAEDPDGIFFDEGDRMRSWDIACTKRFDRFIATHPRVPVIVATGTPGRGSILHYAHLLGWTLRARAPVPIDKAELLLWAAAIDNKPPQGMRAAPGVLGENLESARRWYQRRLTETPGVIIAEGAPCEHPLRIRFVAAPADPKLEAAFESFRLSPEEWDVSDILSRLRHADELGSGFYYKWNPMPPEEYITARRGFCRFVRAQVEVTSESLSPLDTAGAVANAFRDHPVIKRWRAAKAAFGEPNSEPVWISGSVVQAAAEWLRGHPRGIVWTPHVAIGHAVSEVARVPYFWQKGLDVSGRSINDYSGPCVASLKANARERNLQHTHHQNLMIGCPSSGEILEQSLCRTHRSGQDRPVEVDILVTCRETMESYAKAEQEARTVKMCEGLDWRVLRAQITGLSLDNAHDNTYRFGVQSNARKSAVR